jgi:PQQ system protein
MAHPSRMRRPAGARLLSILVAVALLGGCSYARLLRPKVLKQLNPRVVALINEMPEVDRPNEGLVAKLYALGGLSRAKEGRDGVQRDRLRVPESQYIWQPAIIVMRHAGDLELDVTNDDHDHHAALMPSDGDRQFLDLPAGQRGRVRMHLSQPGLYWFGCPVANHVGRGMLGFVFVKGETPPAARLDRPRQERP